MEQNLPPTAPVPSQRKARTRASEAGRPVDPAAAPLAAAAAAAAAPPPPTDVELDLRDKMKSGPRRQAGPTLEGDHPEAAPLAALAFDVMPAPTDPQGL
jgi:hypothetical protein